MIKEAIGLGSNVEEAKEKALLELNVSEDQDIQIEVLETPKKKAFGIFGGMEAKVRVYIELPDNEQQKKKEAAPKKVIDQRPANVEKSKNEKTIKKVKAEKGSHQEKAKNYLKSILTAFGLNDIELSTEEIEGGIQINMAGEGLNAIIGHRGETLDALQYLISFAANSRGSDYVRIVLNSGDFRQKREQALVNLAKKMAEQSKTSGKCRTLEPMNPYERRIIHTTIQTIEGVTSTSFGEVDRCVVIAPEGVTPRPRNDHMRRNNNFKGGRPGFRPRPQSFNGSKPLDDHKAVNDSDAPLYGRIK